MDENNDPDVTPGDVVVPALWYDGKVYAQQPSHLAVCTACFAVIPVWFKERHLTWHKTLRAAFNVPEAHVIDTSLI